MFHKKILLFKITDQKLLKIDLLSVTTTCSPVVSDQFWAMLHFDISKNFDTLM